MGWVTDRHRCTLHLAFEQLRDAVKTDIEEAVGLLTPERRNSFPFGFEDDPSGDRFIAHGNPIGEEGGGQRIRVAFGLFQDRIAIRLVGLGHDNFGPELTVRQKWDAESASCQLCLDGKLVTAAQVSQMALEPLFFGSG